MALFLLEICENSVDPGEMPQNSHLILTVCEDKNHLQGQYCDAIRKLLFVTHSKIYI